MVVPIAVLAITLHEIAHGWVALQLGDSTAADAGRLSANPVRHIDPVGTLVVPIAVYLLGQALGSLLLFGWARPVPVDWRRLKPLRAGIALVALAGPMANLLQLAVWAAAAIVIRHSHPEALLLISLCKAGIMFNAVIMAVNLLPIPPLDGSRVVAAAMPGRVAAAIFRLEWIGLLLVIGLIASGAGRAVLEPVLVGAQYLMLAIGI